MRQEDPAMQQSYTQPPRTRKKASRQEISIEFTRKSIHLLIAFIPLLLSLSKAFTVLLLAGGIMVYSVFETLRMRGYSIPLISALTARAARLRDDGRFVTGPVTLGLGALLTVLLFPREPASIAIYILAFADGLSSLVGKTIGRIRMPLTQGKSLEGSITCFICSLIPSYLISGRVGASLVIALVSTLVEAAPTKDWDNILLPLAAGATALMLGI
ncbi:MAG: SEC59/DGK1/VTE5 family protein [Spirochaetia bacterium]|jgi:dolichol kinase|nr:SEC59/DGK1/VTE5 family protein [Spirochaetia bacterium]